MDIQSIKARFGIIGNAPALNHALSVAEQVSSTDLTVLINGESGVGKEVFSNIIHTLSALKHNPFIAVNYEAIPDGNIDSELSENNAQIQFGQPFVLKHLYNEGNDPEASVRVVGAMFDQFQAPVNPDADVEPRWVERGQSIMREVEEAIPF